MHSSFHLGLLHLINLLISADGVVDAREKAAVDRLRKLENISDVLVREFSQLSSTKTERELFNEGIRLLNECSDQEKIRGIIYLYKISEADNHVHVKEVRLLLYSVKLANVEFNDVVRMANSVNF